MGLDGARSLLQTYKTRHPAVGYADLWALAAVTAVKAMGGPDVPFRAGRIDGTEASPIPVGQLPDASQGANHLRAIFYRMGFSDADIVALSGAHTVGRCHADRTGYSGQWTSSPLRFDSEYFKLLLNCDLSVCQVSELIAANVSALRVLHAILIPRHRAHGDNRAMVKHSIP